MISFPRKEPPCHWPEIKPMRIQGDTFVSLPQNDRVNTTGVISLSPDPVVSHLKNLPVQDTMPRLIQDSGQAGQCGVSPNFPKNGLTSRTATESLHSGCRPCPCSEGVIPDGAFC